MIFFSLFVVVVVLGQKCPKTTRFLSLNLRGRHTGLEFVTHFTRHKTDYFGSFLIVNTDNTVTLCIALGFIEIEGILFYILGWNIALTLNSD